ncbi:hypothetical protein AB1Y20_019294 [Prymnesium parvum]|uniref:Uncharacterized protein n=1 Tax=Prymnesium parvum TaxID=97485 RepID=A0AB34JQU6_PRYPA
MAPWDLRETLKSCNGGTLPDQSVEQFHRAWDQVLRGDHGVASWVQPHRSAYRVRVRNVILPDGEAAPKGGLSLGVHSTTEAAHQHLRDTMWEKLSCECPALLHRSHLIACIFSNGCSSELFSDSGIDSNAQNGSSPTNCC